MDSIFAKTILLLASLLTVLTGSDYIKISSDSLTYDFKTGNASPIYYYLNAENAGIKKVRFDLTSLSSWVSVYKEGDQASVKTSLELAQYTPLNFVLEIHPERLPDGTNKAKVTVEAVDLQDYSVLELKEVNIMINKNLEPATPTPEATFEPSPKASPNMTLTPQPTASLSPDLTQTLKQIQSLIDSIRLFLKRIF
ncbi:MAG: hypothetical protein HY454_02895 [Parcubacteria group bacterium]|nr:hypothetical protein [Parcubacteria group bacterium]